MTREIGKVPEETPETVLQQIEIPETVLLQETIPETVLLSKTPAPLRDLRIEERLNERKALVIAALHHLMKLVPKVLSSILKCLFKQRMYSHMLLTNKRNCRVLMTHARDLVVLYIKNQIYSIRA